MSSWEKDKERSDIYLPEIKRILGAVLISEAPMQEDAHHNTDLMVLKLDAVRIACRVRTHKYLSQYGGEFTIRSGRPNGVKTELAKIIEGWGDYIFYGFGSPDNRTLARYFIGDLKLFRLWHSQRLYSDKGNPPGYQKKNFDGSSNFTSFRLDQMPEGFVINSATHLHETLANPASDTFERKIQQGVFSFT